ncbi:hypothetical protein ACHAPA_007784 [Fusarium lateritium]
MPSVNTFITALVAGLAIGAQAGPCRPHAPSSSVVQSQVTTTQHVESATETSAAYTDAVSISESGASYLPTAVQVTGSTEVEHKPTTTDEDETTTAAYPASESTSATAIESKATTTAYSAVDSTSVASGSLTTESKPEPTSAVSSLATDSTTEPTSSAVEIVSSALLTTAESSAAPYTTSEAEAIPSTTSSEPKTTLDTSAIAPTATSAYPTTTTSQASTTTSTAASSECPPLSELSCGLAGLFTKSDSHLIQVLYDTPIDTCWEECAKNDECKSIGITTADQCEIYDTAVSVMGFSARANWYYSVYDACCHQATAE